MFVNPKIDNVDPNDPLSLAILVVPKFSFYKCPVKNTISEKEMTIAEVYQLIKCGNYQKQTEALRAMTDKVKARDFKAQHYDFVTFSGAFTKREADSLIQHSGLMTLDLDHVSDVKQFKKALLEDRFFETQLLFVSPSGDGLKWVVAIDLEKGTHLEWFVAITNYIKETYQFKLDASGKDVCRCCFLPHDPEVYIHPNYLNCSFSQSFNSKNHANN